MQHYHVKQDPTLATRSRDLSRECHKKLFYAASIVGCLDLVTAITPLERAVNPFDPKRSPPYLHILIWEEHVDRGARIHVPNRELLESCFPLSQYPVFAPQHVVRYNFWRPGDARNTLSRSTRASPEYLQGCAVVDCERDMTLELTYRLRMVSKTGRGTWYQYLHMHESWEPAIEKFLREGGRRC
ncbi:hypothetical protein LTR78_005718 [Recurvomyces mirabilis]|uniref:Uncharacterized protein n=1 Tax=Recurvomyces mirabilis TaxID=574656 RepID=A0AAE0WM47_9PEZI|nr:hypothetical protein LTR78_005718 [Recurvomyces mirabilis]KAK5154098.1 hypothetical protein LTS14_006783 [Recurvomyces mirabilis]